VSERGYMTIGEVVEALSDTYPDLTVSKVRFLEEEGLVTPSRTAGGYRKFMPVDVHRLELVLKLQKEHFLPLSVIREKLHDIDRGKVPAELKGTPTVVEEVALPLEEIDPVPVTRAPDELGLPEEFIRELVEYGLVRPTKGGEGLELHAGDVEIAHACWALRPWGIEPRHLRMFESFAEREAGLFGQVLMPAARHRTPEARQRVVESLEEMTEAVEELKGLMLRRTLRDEFEDLM
jgi:DNA-binding transcriptional MerR regulator